MDAPPHFGGGQVDSLAVPRQNPFEAMGRKPFHGGDLLGPGIPAVIGKGDEPVLGKAELDALGAEGWELIAVVSGSGGLHFYFKRSKRALR